jgi:hypothetical protein
MTFSDWADELCAYYMAIGVPCSEYWHGDYTKLQCYVNAHERLIEQRNQELWLQGLYNYKAFKAVIDAFSWGLNGSKSAKPDGYIEHPLPITEREREAEQQRSIQKTLAWVKAGQSEQ